MSTIDFSIRRRDLAWAVALVVLLSAIWVARSDFADAGGNPPGTGIAVVYITVGTNYPDALGVGPGAGLNGAPIILVPSHPPIPSPTALELERLDPREVVIIGGTSAISATMEVAIETLLPNAAVGRLFGDDRYATNAAFSAATFPVEGWASIPPAAFTATNPDTDDVLVSGEEASNATDGVLRAPIQLPHGAEVLELRISGFAPSLGQVDVFLRRVDGTGDVSLLAEVDIFNDGTATESTTTIDPGRAIVDNETYAYMVVVSGANALSGLITVRVRYRLGASNG